MTHAGTAKHAWMEWAAQHGLTDAVTKHATFHDDGTVTWEGDCDLSRNDITALPAGLAHVSGTCDLSENTLQSLAGLAGVTIVNDLVLCRNALESVDGLAGVTVGGSLHLEDNSLWTLEGFTEVSVGGTLYLAINPLTSLKGLVGVTIGGDLFLAAIPDIADLSHDMPASLSVGGNIIIDAVNTTLKERAEVLGYAVQVLGSRA